MTNLSFNINRAAPQQSDIDTALAALPNVWSIFGRYAAAFCAACLIMSVTWMYVAHQAVLFIGWMIALSVLCFCVMHCENINDHRRKLSPITDEEMEKMAEFFKADHLSPNVLRYKSEVVAQDRAFTWLEYWNLQDHNDDWIESERAKAVRDEIYATPTASKSS